MDIIGALEHDPELTTRQSHRTYLTEQVTFKEAVPTSDSAILSKIHQTYRIGYIKDAILPRVLDDQTFASMNSIILLNNVSVVSSLHKDSAFLSELFSKLRSPETPEQNRRDLVPRWYPLSVVTGGITTKMMVGAMKNEWGKKLYEGTLTRNIAGVIYKDERSIQQIAIKQYSMLKAATGFQYDYKIMDPTKPQSALFASDVAVR